MPSTLSIKKRKRASKDNSNSNILELKAFSIVSFLVRLYIIIV